MSDDTDNEHSYSYVIHTGQPRFIGLLVDHMNDDMPGTQLVLDVHWIDKLKKTDTPEINAIITEAIEYAERGVEK